jgi:hypothetical protein
LNKNKETYEIKMLTKGKEKIKNKMKEIIIILSLV